MAADLNARVHAFVLVGRGVGPDFDLQLEVAVGLAGDLEGVAAAVGDRGASQDAGGGVVVKQACAAAQGPDRGVVGLGQQVDPGAGLGLAERVQRRDPYVA